MPPRRALLPVLACLLLAGCSLPATESTEGTADDEDVVPDKSEYDESSAGIAVRLANRAPDAFEVTIRIATSDGGEVTRYDAVVGSNTTMEKWWSLGVGGYLVDMHYRVRSGARSASGSDERAVEVGGECDGVRQLGWRYLRLNETGQVGSARLSSVCLRAGAEAT